MHNLSLHCQDKRAQSNSREVLARKTGTSNLMTKAMQKGFCDGMPETRTNWLNIFLD
jgi:hypothetical protein